MSKPQLLIATHNQGKLREYRGLLRDAPFELVSLDQVGITHDVEETGVTFKENAILKARAYAALSGMLTLADDSGLEVDALGGEPGIYSSRYGEKSTLPLFIKVGPEGMSDEDRLRLLLHNLEAVPWERRTARFRCVIAIVDSSREQIPSCPPFEKGGWGDLTTMVGSVAGMIQYEAKGDEGFGYDPVFYLPSYRRTIAQLPLEEKNRISHRSDAARKAAAVLKSY